MKSKPDQRRSSFRYSLLLLGLFFVFPPGCGGEITDATDDPSTESVTRALTPGVDVSTNYFSINSPMIGQTLTGTAFTFSGYAAVGGMDVALQRWNSCINPLDPAGCQGDWVLMTTVKTPSTPINVGGDNAYEWSASLPFPTDWIVGGLFQVRAVPAITPTLPASYDAGGSFNISGSECLAAQNAMGAGWAGTSQICSSIHNLGGADPLIVTGLYGNKLPTTHSPNFLAKPLGNNPATSAGYYQAIGAPASLAAFKTKYGFPAGDTRLTYYNNGDLGIGREMHCVAKTISGAVQTACYVSNYAPIVNGKVVFGDKAGSMALANTGNVNNSFATVAMVKNRTTGRVDFMVYARAQPLPGIFTFNLSTTAQLDNVGFNTQVPQNCLGCHGIDARNYLDRTAGALTTANMVKNNSASFLAFEPDVRVLQFAAAKPNATELNAIKAFNKLVYESPAAPGVRELISDMYAGAPDTTTADSFYHEGHRPSSWCVPGYNGYDMKLYDDAVVTTCIGCHSTASNVPPSGALNTSTLAAGSGMFASLSLFRQGAGSGVPDMCRFHSMPHSERAANIFWQSPARVYLLQSINGTFFTQCNP